MFDYEAGLLKGAGCVFSIIFFLVLLFLSIVSVMFLILRFFSLLQEDSASSILEHTVAVGKIKTKY